jgi:hypothetical protein
LDVDIKLLLHDHEIAINLKMHVLHSQDKHALAFPNRLLSLASWLPHFAAAHVFVLRLQFAADRTFRHNTTLLLSIIA